MRAGADTTCDGSSIPTPPNAQIQSGGTASQDLEQPFLSTLVFPCIEGFSGALSLSAGSTLATECLAGSTGAVSFTCTQTSNVANGAFTSSHTCEPVTCDGTVTAVPIPPHAEEFDDAESTAERGVNQVYGSIFVFECSAGYTGTVVYECGQTSLFQPLSDGSGCTGESAHFPVFNVLQLCVFS